MLCLSILSVTDFSHVNRKNCDKVRCLFIALFSGSLKSKQTKYNIVTFQEHSISAPCVKFTKFT